MATNVFWAKIALIINGLRVAEFVALGHNEGNITCSALIINLLSVAKHVTPVSINELAHFTYKTPFSASPTTYI